MITVVMLQVIAMLSSAIIPIAVFCGKVVYHGEGIITQLVMEYREIMVVIAVLICIYHVNSMLFSRRPPRLNVITNNR